MTWPNVELPIHSSFCYNQIYCDEKIKKKSIRLNSEMILQYCMVKSTECSCFLGSLPGNWVFNVYRGKAVCNENESTVYSIATRKLSTDDPIKESPKNCTLTWNLLEAFIELFLMTFPSKEYSKDSQCFLDGSHLLIINLFHNIFPFLSIGTHSQLIIHHHQWIVGNVSFLVRNNGIKI